MPQALHTPPNAIQPVKPRTGITLTLNGESFTHTGDPAMPLLWYLRDVLQLTGTKYGCDDATCGACSVLVDGKLKLACQLQMQHLAGHEVTTVEGLEDAQGSLHPLQKAWIAEDAIMCGFCQPGQLMAAADLLRRTPNPGDREIDRIPNLCRCGSYPRIRKAIKRAAAEMRKHTS